MDGNSLTIAAMFLNLLLRLMQLERLVSQFLPQSKLHLVVLVKLSQVHLVVLVNWFMVSLKLYSMVLVLLVRLFNSFYLVTMKALIRLLVMRGKISSGAKAASQKLVLMLMQTHRKLNLILKHLAKVMVSQSQ